MAIVFTVPELKALQAAARYGKEHPQGSGLFTAHQQQATVRALDKIRLELARKERG